MCKYFDLPQIYAKERWVAYDWPALVPSERAHKRFPYVSLDLHHKIIGGQVPFSFGIHSTTLKRIQPNALSIYRLLKIEVWSELCGIANPERGSPRICVTIFQGDLATCKAINLTLAMMNVHLNLRRLEKFKK